MLNTFPNTLIFFEKYGYCYGFDETAAMISMICGYRVYKKDDMLVIKFEKSRFQQMIKRGQMRGYRLIIDKSGKLTFISGNTFHLEKPLSYYKNNPDYTLNKKPLQKPVRSYTKNGGGWHDDAWTPGLPSSRFFRTKKK